MTPNPPFAMPLYADLDDTVVRTDTLWESLVLAAKRRPAALLACLPRLAAGKAPFKRALARTIVPDPSGLPYDPEVMSFLRGRRAAGQEVILATAADEEVARPVAAHLGVFTAV